MKDLQLSFFTLQGCGRAVPIRGMREKAEFHDDSGRFHSGMAATTSLHNSLTKPGHMARLEPSGVGRIISPHTCGQQEGEVTPEIKQKRIYSRDAPVEGAERRVDGAMPASGR